jgi:UDP-4-amino-4,6-dideoxy-N-acetyl-beta-L-altrosamine transaminase
MKNIPYGKQHITEDDIKEVEKVLRSDFLTQGPKIKEFETAFAKYIGSKYAVAVANGTAALHLSALAMNIQPGDKVITVPITFAASANCIVYAGGEVDFVDIDPDTYLMDINKLEEKLNSKPPGTYKGVIPVDFAGYPMNMEKVRRIADKHNLWIIEDSCHAPGGYFFDSKRNKQHCGNGNYSDIAMFSFHPVKHIASAEGGMITTNNEKLYKKLKILRTHGITQDPEIMMENHGGWYYEMVDLGFNYRLSDIHAALGLSQLGNLNDSLKKRNSIAKRYNKAFYEVKITTPTVQENFYHAYHLYIILTENRLGLYDYLKKHNIYTQIHYIPIHLHPYYRKKGWKKGDFPIAEKYYEKCISLPMYPTLTRQEQDYVIEKMQDFHK